MSLRDLEQRALRRLGPLGTVERAAFFSNGFVVAIAALGVARFVRNPHALADGDVGGDFRGFWEAGGLVRLGRSSHLYDSLVAMTRGGPSQPVYMHPPAVAALFAPLSLLPYGAALVVFWALSAAALFGACAIASRELDGPSAPRSLGVALRFAPLAYAFAYGQLTPLLVLPLVLFVVSLRRSRDVPAGLWLGLFAIKPQMALGLGLYLLLQRRFRAAAASLVSGAVVTASSFVFFPEAARRYEAIARATFAWSRLSSARPWAEIGFFRLGTNTLDAASPLAGTIAGAALAVAGLAWLVAVAARRREVASREWDLALAAVIPLSLMLSPYLFHYDAGLLFVSFLLASHRLRRARLEPKQPYFTDGRVGVAVFAACFFLAIGPGLGEIAHDRLGLSLGLQPATLGLAYAVYAVVAAAG